MAKITFLSTAHIHTQNFLKDLDGRTRAIWDDVPDRGRRYAEKHGVKFIDRLEDALADPDADGFVICAENTRHLPLLKHALATGKPVFCEKPLTTSSAELREVAGVWNKKRSPLICGYFQPFSGEMQAVARMLSDEAFGRVTRVKFRNAHHAAYARWFDGEDLRWFCNPELSGGGALMDMGTHAVHLLRTLFGPVLEVWAMTANHAGVYPEVDDYGIAHLKFKSGVLGTVEAAWTQTGGIGGLEIVGSKQSLWYNGKQYVFGAPGAEETPLVSAPSQPDRMDRLVAAIQGRLTPSELMSDLECIFDSVSIMESAYLSHKMMQWVNVPSVKK